MVDERFSEAAFLACGLDTPAAKQLADQLADQIHAEMHPLIEAKVREIVERLNGMGHHLKLLEEPVPGYIGYRDDYEDEGGYHCRLRVAFDSIVSTGYAQMFDPDADPEDDEASPSA